MHDALAVRAIERGDDRTQRGQQLAWPELRLGEAATVDVLHHDERPAVDLAEVEDLHDRRVVESRRESRLAAKALDIRPARVAEELDRDRPVEVVLVPEVHRPRAAASDPAHHAVAGRRRRRLVGQAIGAEEVGGDRAVQQAALLRVGHGTAILMRPADSSAGSRVHSRRVPHDGLDTIQQAGARNAAALEDFARDYLPPVRQFVAARGFAAADADDLTQEVFLRVLSGDVLAHADGRKGRFRSLLLAIAMHVVSNRRRQRRDVPRGDLDPVDRDPDFDRAWIRHLAERAMVRLRAAESPYYDVIRGHLEGSPQSRNKLWIARRSSGGLIRDEVARTCDSAAQIEEELGYLQQYLRPLSGPRGFSQNE